MRDLLKKILTVLLVILISTTPVSAKDKVKNKVKFLSNISNDFTLSQIPNEIQFKTIKKTSFPQNVVIPQRSVVSAKVIRAQRELRWHKSGFILCKLDRYVTEYNETFDISDKNIYLIARKWEPVNKKEVSILATEIVLTQAASFFAPGVDILYFFTKGAIQREKDPHWFKAGVHNAYENSICWFWLKGKPINLEKDSKIQLKGIKEEKIEKLTYKIDKRFARESAQNEDRKMRKRAKHDKKEIKHDIAAAFDELKKEEPSIIKTELDTQMRENAMLFVKGEMLDTPPEKEVSADTEGGIEVEISPDIEAE